MVENPQQILEFLNKAERLKTILRHSYLSNGRKESVADHSWRLALMALVLEKEFPKIDINRVIKIVLVHDFGEIICGDLPAFPPKPHPEKSENERKAMKILIETLSKEKGNEILGLWEEYENAITEEGKLAKALDKIEALIQHNECDPSTLEEGEAEFNLEYSRKYTDAFEFMKALRALVDEQTKKTIEKRKN